MPRRNKEIMTPGQIKTDFINRGIIGKPLFEAHRKNHEILRQRKEAAIKPLPDNVDLRPFRS